MRSLLAQSSATEASIAKEQPPGSSRSLVASLDITNELFAVAGKAARADDANAVKAEPVGEVAPRSKGTRPDYLVEASDAEADEFGFTSDQAEQPEAIPAAADDALAAGVADTELVENEVLEAWGSVASVADLGAISANVRKSPSAQLYLTSVSFSEEEPIIAAAPVEAVAPPVAASLADVEAFARAKAAPAKLGTPSVVRIPFYPGLPLSRARHIKGATGTVYEGKYSEARFIAKEKKCLAEAIYFEARGEPILGQFAVAQTVLNRVRTGYYPEHCLRCRLPGRQASAAGRAILLRL